MELKSAAAESHVGDTRSDVHNFFIQRIRKYLHIVLTMSPAGSKLRRRCRMNPALISCCTLDWYEEWPREAELRVAEVYFQSTEFVAGDTADIEVREDAIVLVILIYHVLTLNIFS